MDTANHPEAFSTELRILRPSGTSTDVGRLQYRVKKTEFGGGGDYGVYLVRANVQWSDWMDVPVVVQP